MKWIHDHVKAKSNIRVGQKVRLRQGIRFELIEPDDIRRANEYAKAGRVGMTTKMDYMGELTIFAVDFHDHTDFSTELMWYDFELESVE